MRKKKVKEKFQWLERDMIRGPYLTLCLSETCFRQALAHCGITEHVNFTRNGTSDAATHYLQNQKGDMVAIVCMRGWERHTGIMIAGLLVHEATHVWQEWCDRHGEDAPSREFEAYAIQGISQELMWEFARQTGQKQ